VCHRARVRVGARLTLTPTLALTLTPTLVLTPTQALTPSLVLKDTRATRARVSSKNSVRIGIYAYLR
jgi:hypothetical protein